MDITESKGMSDFSKEQENKFAKIFQNSPGIVIITTIKDGIIIDANNGINLTGYLREDLIGKSIIETDLWNSLSQRDLYINKLSRYGRVENFEADFKKKSGEIITCLLSGEVIRLNNHDCMIKVLTDISERKQLELEMKVLTEMLEGVAFTADLNDLFHLIHQSLKKIIYAENCFFALYNPQTNLFDFPYFADQFDTAPSPLGIAKSCTNYVFEKGKSMLINQDEFEALVAQNEVVLVGSPSPSWIGIILRTSNKVIGILVLQHYEKENVYNERHLKFLDSIASQVANVIERKRAENELEKSYSLIAAALESTADGILVVDKMGKITNFNNKFIELWRIPDSIMSTKDDEVILSFVLDQLTDPESFLNKVKELYINEEEISSDTIEFKDGRIFERFSQSQKFQGNSVGRVWSFRDVTEARKAIRSLYESEARLRDLNAEKDKFFSIIAHDLKSPFNSILGFTNLLAEQVKQKDFDGVEEYAEIIRHSSQKAMDLLTNLMEWSRSQSGRMDFNPEYIEIGTLINEICELSNVAALQKSISLTKELPHHISAFIDRSMISSVIRNLISNAIKFTHPGGAIVIKAEQLDRYLKVSITDNGVGIEKSDLQKLFTIDENFSVPGTQDERGTGLGLVLCKEFVEKHKGTIRAESEPGKGSRFFFIIPRH
jgi:PAS domain S-box-containing protein